MLARGILEPAPPTKRRAGPQRQDALLRRAGAEFLRIGCGNNCSLAWLLLPNYKTIEEKLTRDYTDVQGGSEVLGGRAIEPLKREKAKARSGMRTDLVQNCHEVMGKTRDIVAREGRNAAFAAPPHAPSLSEETYVGQNRHASCDPDSVVYQKRHVCSF